VARRLSPGWNRTGTTAVAGARTEEGDGADSGGGALP
jgi:hypothetical protein